MKELYVEAKAAFDSAAEGALMSITNNHDKAPGVKDVEKVIKLMASLRQKTGQSQVAPKQLAQAATQQGVQPQAVVQFCDAVLDSGERDEFGGYGHEILQQTRDAFSDGKTPHSPFAA